MHRIAAFVVALTTSLCVSTSPAADPESTDHQPKLLVVFIGGMDSDPTPEQIAGTAGRNQGNSGMFQLCRATADERIHAEYFNWNGTRAGDIKSPQPPRAQGIAEFIHAHVQSRPGDRVALVGNSWGGHTALEVLEQLRHRDAPVAVQLAVFLDPSSTGRAKGPPQAFPENACRLVNIHTRNLFVWTRLPGDKRLETIDLGDPATGYMRDGRPAYNATFDFSAHVAAEWDERVHAEIERRLQGEIVDSR